jgi:formylglycine-generating enzyme required for sulfatase activity
MTRPTQTPPRRPRATAKAKIQGGGAIAQGGKAKAAGPGAVLVARDNAAPINTGAGNIYQTIVQQAALPGGGAGDLRRGYLAWLSLRANELPLFAGDSGRPAQLASVYTALLTRAREPDWGHAPADTPAERARAEREAAPQSALEALDSEQYLVLMGGPGSGKTTFLNMVALCLAGERLGLAGANLKRLRAPIPAEPDDDAKKRPKPQRWRHQALLSVRVLLRDFAAALPPAGTPLSADALWGFIVAQLPVLLRPHADDLKSELLGQGGLILLDGLDEVPDALRRREQVKQAIQELAGVFRGCRFLVTSRTYAYQRQDWKLAGFAERELLPFTRGQIERFVDTWYTHMAHDLFRLTEADALARAEVLKRACLRPELQELAERPLLLTLMARLQTKGGGTLPENREALYAQSVDMLLDEWEGLKLSRDAQGQPIIAEPSLSEWLDASREGMRRELDKLAYAVHLNQSSLVGTADIRQGELIVALMAASRDRPDAKLARLEEYLRDRAGLLASHGDGLYQFPHRSFQEYLAACHLARFDFPDTLGRLVKTDPNRWREVALLAAARSKDTPSAVWELVEELCAEDPEPAPHGVPDGSGPVTPAQWGALVAAQVLAETGLAAPDPGLQARHERKRLRVRDWQVCLLRSRVLPARERALAGDLLAALGDPRRHLLDLDAMRFAAVPRGAFWMGEAGDADGELHRNETLDYDYWIAQAPVTVAQYRQFFAGSGDSQSAQDGLQAPDNRPVVAVSWHDALAFCAWLTERWRDRLPAGWAVMLPSEAEWEKAARGGEHLPATIQVASLVPGFGQGLGLVRAASIDNPLPQRTHPWGAEFLADNANTEMTLGTTSTPGCFAQGQCPYGCDDMAGNVWEWTRSLWGTDWQKPDFVYPYDSDDQRREAPGAEQDVYRVVRGGSWFRHRVDARCAYRFRLHPDLRNVNLGFRVVLRAAPVSSAPSSGDSGL